MTPPHHLSQDTVSESAFMRQVTDLANLLGYEWAHFRPAQTSKGWRTPVSGSLGAGYPDLILVRPRDRRLIFAELKAQGKKPSPNQTRVLEVLRSLENECVHGPRVEVAVWEPRDFDAVAELLR